MPQISQYAQDQTGKRVSVTEMSDKGLISMQHKHSHNPDVFKVRKERLPPAPEPLP